MMNISFPYSGGLQCSVHCVTPCKIPGNDIDIDAETTEACNSNRRIVKEVPCDRLLLVDTCYGHDHLKTVSSDCSFFIPENNDELNEAKPILKELMDRKIFVLTEASRPDLKSIKEECRRSFFSSEGALINDKFEMRNLTPLRMAEAGLKFVGDGSKDITQCYFNENHRLYSWEESDKPVDEHIQNFNCLCIDDMKYRIPVLSSTNGEEIKGDAYHLVMPEKREGILGHYCNAATIISHHDAPIKQIGFNELLPQIDHGKLVQVNTSLEKKLKSREIDGDYFDLLKQSFNFEHFPGLLRKFERANQEFIDLLESYKSKLKGCDVAEAERILITLKSSHVKEEIESTVEKLANLEMVKSASVLLDHLPKQIREAGLSAMKSTAVDDFKRFASRHSGRIFCDDFLNDLVSTGKLGCLFSSNYFKSDKRDENLMQILEKGTELTETLVNISEKIHVLVDHYLPAEIEVSGDM